MRFPVILSLAALASAAAVFGCSSSLETFQCETNADCISEDQNQRGGICESSQVCSFADPECTGSGQRYGPASGSQSNSCVGETPGSPDAATTNTTPDAGPRDPDAAIDVPPADAGPDAEPGCPTLLTLTVFDDHEANDFVSVKNQDNSEILLECQPAPTSPDQDSMIVCEVCMPAGADIELKAESGIRLESLITDCDNSCLNDSNCKFIATTSCSAVYHFDTEFTLPP